MQKIFLTGRKVEKSAKYSATYAKILKFAV